jgi:hypothetical protein
MSANAPIRHVIQDGETLSQIAQKYGVTPQEIRNFHNQNAHIDDLMSSVENFTNNEKLNYVLIPPDEERIPEDENPTEENPNSQKASETESEENAQEENQESSKGEASEHDQKYVVIQKGYCVCDQSIPPNMVPVQFKVDSHQLQHANGEEQDHLIVTEEDVFFQKSSQPFGSQCKLQPNSSSYNPCSYAPAGKWQKTYSKIQVQEKAVLTELSELQCAIGGKITVFQHGQSQKVTNAHFGNVELEELQAISPLAEKPELERPSVEQIQAKLPLQNDKTQSGTSKYKKPEFKKGSSDGVAEITVRVDESVEFSVIKYKNEEKADKSRVSWKVLKGFDWVDETAIQYSNFGETLKVNFDVVGKYRVFAFGNEDKVKQADNRCAIDVHVVINQLKKSTKGIKTVGNHFNGQEIRRGFPVNFQPDFELPTTQEELARVEMGVKDAQGNVVDSNFSPSTGLIFTPNNAIKYKVWISYTQQDGTVQTFENQYEAKPNIVDAIQASPSADKFRPGTIINFSVSKMRFSPIDNDPDYANIKWNVNGVTAPERGNNFSKRFDQTGNYLVEAFMKAADGEGTDTYKVVVVENFVHTISIKKHPKAGSYGEFKIDKYELSDYQMSKDGQIKWVIEGPTPGMYNDEEYIKHKFTKPGYYTISCFLGKNACKEPLKIEVKQPIIKPETSKWIDRDNGSGNVIKKAGYGQTVCAYVDYEGLENEKVYLDIYDNDSTGDNIVCSVQGELMGKTGMYWPIKLSDEINKKIKEKGLASYGDLYFKIRPLEPDLKVINGNSELGKHLRVNETPEIVNAYFTDVGDKQKLRFCKLNEKLYFKVYATNYVGKKVKVHFITISDGYYRWKGMELQDWDDIKDYFKNENFFHSEEATFNENGEILVEVPLSKLGTPKKHFLINGAIELPAEEGKKPKGVYVEMADRTFIFKTNANAEELKNSPAPLIVDRVSINTGKLEENGTCVCKDYDLIWGNKVSCEFRKKVVQVAKNLGLPQKDNEGANWLMAVFALETGRKFDPTVGTFKSNPDDNREGGYVGLIQFGKGASADLGIKRSQLLKMTIEEQLDYAEKHFKKKFFSGKLKSKTDLYLAVNYPNSCGHGTERDYVVYDSSKAAYDDNPLFKREKDEYWIDKNGKKHYYEGKEGKSYVWEFEEAINDFYEEGKSNTASAFTCNLNNSSEFKATDIITIHIYSDGKLEKHVPKVIKEENKNKYQYVYHDVSGSEHIIGTVNFKTIKNVYGSVYGGNTVDLIDISELKNYAKGNTKFTLTLNTERKYINEKTLGSLIGAMLECGYDDYVFNGFSHSDGGSKPSKSHKNGYNGDFRYLRKDKKGGKTDLFTNNESIGWKGLDEERQNKFNDALYKFGWKSMLSQFYGEKGNKLLNHCTNDEDKNHNDHLHIQGYKPNYKELIE